ncbi:hypothetical protein EMCRGX_G022029 [Ephydatia muelleri]
MFRGRTVKWCSVQEHRSTWLSQTLSEKKDGGGDYTEEFATHRIDTGLPGHDNQPVFLRKHLASLRVLAL